MARGICFYISNSKENEDIVFDADSLAEDRATEGCFDYATDMDEQDSKDSIGYFLESLQRHGVVVDAAEGAFTITRRAVQSWFAQRYEKFQAAAAAISLADFASNSGNYWDLRGFMEDRYSDAVWLEDYSGTWSSTSFHTVDDFMRRAASVIRQGQEDVTYYVRGAVIIH